MRIENSLNIDLLADAPIAFALIEPKSSKILESNNQFSLYSGQSIKKLKGSNLIDLIADEFKEKFQKMTFDVSEGMTVFDEEFKMKTPELKSQFLSISGKILRDEFGANAAIRLFFKDITALKEIQTDLRKSRETFKYLYNSTPAMLHSIDSEGHISMVSDYWLETMGYSRVEVIGRKSIEFLSEESRKFAVEVILPNYFKTGFCHNVPYKFVKKSGEEMDVLLSATSEMDDDGNLIKSLAVITNITDRVDAERRHRESEERLDLAIRGTNDGIWDWMDITNSKQWWSPRFYSILGYGYEEIEPALETFTDVLLHPDDSKMVEKAVDDCFKKDIPFDVEYRFKCKNGEYKWLRGRANVIRNMKGEPIRMAGSISDIHEKKLNLERLEKQRKQLEKTNKDLEQFAYVTTHDIKAPIANIEGFFQLLKDKINIEENKQIIFWLDESIKRSKTLLDDLIRVTKSRQDNHDDVQEINLNDMASEASYYMHSEINQIGAKLLWDFSACPTIQFSLIDARSIFHNLISNALKYYDPKKGAEVKLTSYSEEKFDCLEISDNGLGIDMEKFGGKIFSMFKRAHKHVEGSGMGLYLIKKIIEKNGGKITVKSDLGKGTSFILFFPRNE